MPWQPKSLTVRLGVRQQKRKDYDKYQRKDDGFYDSPAWRSLRLVVLYDEPICRVCKGAVSTDVDHIRPRLEHPTLAWERSNLQGLCHPCHSRKTLAEVKERAKKRKRQGTEGSEG